MEINQTKWNQFCADPATILNLESNIHSWIEEISGFAIPHLHQGKNKLGGRSEPGSPVIWYQSGHTPQGVPFVNATFSTFKNGGLTKTFDSKEALQAIYEERKSSQPAKAQKFRATQIAKKEKNDKDHAKFAAECLARDLALWDSLPTEGTSGYLDRKAVGDVARGLDCIRYGAGFILVRIIDAAGVLRGFQKIFDDGSKRFTAGLKKKGAFVVLGAQSGPVYIVEGLATGLSVRKAIGATVVCALDAGNLEPVVKSLRKAARGLKIIIAADNDHTKAQKLNPQTGLPIGNTGLKKAHRAAIKYRCLVASPGFTPDDPGTDFNDLHQAHGLNAVRDDLDMTARPNPALAYQGERESQIARKAKAFSRFELCRMESKYLPAENLRVAFERPDVKTIVAASPIGSGKTEAVAQLINGLDPNDRVLYISHLVSLNADAATRLGLEMYSDYKGHRADGDCKLTELPRVAVCLNSLPMLVANTSARIQPFEVVVIDEIEQLIRRLTTPIDQKRLVIDVLKYLVQHAKKLILLDAHIGKGTLELLDMWRPDGGLVLWNTYQPATNRTVRLYPDKETLISTAVEAVTTGEKVFFCANSKNEARRVFKLMQKISTAGHGLYISGDNRGDADVTNFLADVNKQATSYDFIVVSPAICTGVNIDNGHFTWVGGAFRCDVNTPADCVQALGRVRDIGTLHVWADDRRVELQSTDPDEIAARWTETRKHDRQFLGLTDEGLVGLTDMDYAAIVRTVGVSEGFQKNNFFEIFLKLLNDDGFRFEWQKSTKETATGLYQEGKELERVEHIQMRVDAPDLTPDEVDAIHNQTHHTLEQTVALDRYDLKEFYVIDESEIPTFVEFDRRGKGRAELRNLEIALADGAELQRLTTLESNKLIPDQPNFFVVQSLFSTVLAAVGVNCRNFTLNSDFRYSTDSLQWFVEWIEANRHILRGVVRIPPPEILATQPVRFISVVLQKMGLKQHRVGRNAKGQYGLDRDRFEQMRAILERRRTLPIQISASGDTSCLYRHEDSECPKKEQ